MARFYFEDGSEICYTLKTHKQQMRENLQTERVLYEAKREVGSPYFYCKEFFHCGEVSESCGKQCEAYKPNNGKSGRCAHYGYVYEQTENKLTLTL